MTTFHDHIFDLCVCTVRDVPRAMFGDIEAGRL